jgi:hypothetical protein
VSGALITLSPVELYLKVSEASVGACEVGANAGPYCKRVLGRTGNKEGDPWCASQFTDWGVIALGNRWPLVHSASVMVIAEDAKKKECRFVGVDEPAQVGDGLAIWFPSLKRWAHICVVVNVSTTSGAKVLTRDGNTNADGGREGWLVAEKHRTITRNDRLIRWANLL